MATLFDATFTRLLETQGVARGHLSEQAYREVLSRIVGLELEPGRAFSEGELATRLGLSKTPVREALLSLRHLGLVEAQAGSGYRVGPIGDIAGMWKCQAMLEREAASGSGPVRTDDEVVPPPDRLAALFDVALADYSEPAISVYTLVAMVGPAILIGILGNEHLARMATHLQPHLQRSLRLALTEGAAHGRFPPAIDDRELVVAALTGDGDTARRLLAARAGPGQWVVETLAVNGTT